VSEQRILRGFLYAGKIFFFKNGSEKVGGLLYAEGSYTPENTVTVKASASPVKANLY
jgi:predicted outer membrane repeat protein